MDLEEIFKQKTFAGLQTARRASGPDAAASKSVKLVTDIKII